MPPRRHRNHSGTDGTGTLDVQGRITDHPDSARIHVSSAALSHSRQSLACHVTTIEMIVAESAKGKVVRNPIVAEFESGAVPDVPREQAHGHIASFRKQLQHLGNAWQHLAGA